MNFGLWIDLFQTLDQIPKLDVFVVQILIHLSVLFGLCSEFLNLLIELGFINEQILFVAFEFGYKLLGLNFFLLAMVLQCFYFFTFSVEQCFKVVCVFAFASIKFVIDRVYSVFQTFDCLLLLNYCHIAISVL